MRSTARQAITLGLSLAMAFGTVPTQALAEAIEEVGAPKTTAEASLGDDYQIVVVEDGSEKSAQAEASSADDGAVLGEEIEVTSQSDLVADDPTAADSVYNELKSAYEQAKADAEAAATTLDEKEQAYQNALDAVETVRDEVGARQVELQAAVDAAKSALDDAVADRDAKQTALADAQAEVDANTDAITQAEQDLSAKQTVAAQKANAVTSAQSTVTSAQNAYDDATADVATKQEAVDAKVAEAEAKAAEGSFGFFQSVGATNAIDALEGCTYKDKIKKGEEVDATSLENMRATLQWISRLNSIRSGLGLNELKVSDLLMAYAQANADYSDTVIGHSGQFTDLSLTGNTYGENAAWNYGSNPFAQWYDQEKTYFDAAYKSITGNATAPEGVAAYSWYQDNKSAVNQYVTSTYGSGKSVGHYMNDISPNFSTCGFGICTRNTKYPFTYVQYFGGDIASFTVGEYEQRFMEYYNSVKGEGVAAAEKQALTEAKAVQAEKKTALDNATAALATAQDEKTAADDAVSAAQTTLAGLNDQTAGLVDARDNAQSELAAAESTVTTKQSAYDQATSELDGYDGEAQIAAAQAAADTAMSERDAALVDKEAADAAYAEAAEALGVARRISDDNVTVEGIVDATYDRTEHTQNAELFITMSKDGRTQTYKLASGTDYEVEYFDNTNVGTAKVTFTGKGDYAGSITREFSIASAAVTSLEAIAPQTYNGSAIMPTLVVRAGDLTLDANEYDASYENNVNAGTATVTVTGKGNFSGAESQTFTIDAADIDAATVTIENQTYTGKALTPAPTVKMGDQTLVANTDYTVSYEDNENAGTATVKVTGKGNYSGAKSQNFTIAKAPRSIELAQASYAKTVGDESFELGASLSAGNGTLAYTSSDEAVATVDDDGTVTVVGVGEATITVSVAETDNYKAASAKVGVSVAPVTVAITGVELSPSSATYDGREHVPTVAVVADDDKVPAGGYDVRYLRGGKETEDLTSAGTVTVEVTGKGNYTGTATGTFTIARAKVAAPTATNRTYNGKAQTGVAADAGYKLSGTAKATNAGTYTATATPDANHCWADGTTAAKSITWSIAKAASSIKLADQSKTYTGKAIAYTGDITMSGSAGVMTLAYYSDAACTKPVAVANVKNAGTYYVKGTLAADANYKAATSAAAKLTIAKAAQPMKLKAVKRTAKASATKKKAVTVAAPLKFTKKAQGAVTYARVAKGSAKCLTVNKKTGKVTIKKGTKKGSYKVKIKVTAKGNANYKSGNKTIVCTVVVK